MKLRLFPRLRAAVLAASVSFTFVTLASGSLGFAQEEQPVEEDAVEVTEEPAEANVLLCEEEAEQLEMALAEQDQIERELAAEEQEEEEIVIPHIQTMFGCDVESPTEYPLTAVENTSDAGVVVQLTERADAFAADAEQMILSGVLTEEEEERELPTMVLSSTSVEYPKASVAGQGAAAPRATSVPRLFPAAAAPAPVFFLSGEVSPLAEPEENYASLNQYISRQNGDSVVLNKQSGTFDFGTISKNIRLEGDGVMVLGDVAVNSLTTFIGNISGNAVWVQSSPANSTYVFQGDVSDWTGKVTTSENNSGPSTFRFTGSNAREKNVGTSFDVEYGTVNVEFLQPVVSSTGSYTQSDDGKLNVAVGGKNSTTAATFTQQLNVNDFTVSSGSSLTLKQGAKFNGLLSVDNDALLTFESGDLVLNGRADIRGAVKLAQDTNLIVNGSYSIYGSTDSEMKGNVTIGSGAAITVNGFNPKSPLVIEGNLTLMNGATFDFAPVQSQLAQLLETQRMLTFATVNGTVTAKMDTNTDSKTRMLGSVIVANTGLGGTNLVRAFKTTTADNVTKIELWVENDTSGLYWHGGASGVWQNKGDSTAVWTKTSNGSGVNEKFVTSQGALTARSAYFFDDIVANITVKSIDKDFYIKNLIVGAGDYTFSRETNDTTTAINLDVNARGSLTVRSGASATFNFGIFANDDSAVVVEKNAQLTIRDGYLGDVGLGTGYNAGHLILEGAGGSIIRRMTNYGVMEIQDYSLTDEQVGDLTIGSIVNAEEATLRIAKSYIIAAPVTEATAYGTFITNNGKLIFDTEASFHDITNWVGIEGNGILQTIGDKQIQFEDRVFAGVVYSQASVTTAYAYLEAAKSTFRTNVNVTDLTTIGAVSEVEFFKSSYLADVVMKKEAQLVFDHGNMEDWQPTQYWVNSVTSAESGIGMTLRNGVSVVVEQDINAPELTITLQETDSLTVNGNFDAKSLIIREDSYAGILSESGENVLGTTIVENAYFEAASYTRMEKLDISGKEDYSKVILTRGGYVDNVTIANGTLILDAGAVLTLGNVMQNTSGKFTLEAATGTSINADLLHLVKDGEGYVEVGATESTPGGSGFACTSEEKVQVVMNSGYGATLNAAGTVVTHAEASGDLILEDNGWAVLHNSEINWTTYFVREDYVEGVGSKDKHITLSAIQDASKNGGTDVLLKRVTFDKDSTFHGRLLVDDNVAASLFTVAHNAQGTINIAENNTVLADSGYAGVTGKLLLEGKGIYHIDSRTNLGTNVSLKNDGWNGNVLVTGRSGNLALSGLSVGAGDTASAIIFRDWMGSLSTDSEISNAKIVLDSVENGNAITLNNVTGATYAWNNTVSGAGNIVRQDNAKEAFNLRFGGDTKNWTGKFVQEQDTVSNLTYTGSGYTVNSGVEVQQGVVKVQYLGKNTTVHSDFDVQEQGKLQLIVGIDNNTTDGAEVVFDGAFNGTESSVLTVYQDSSATFDTNAALEYVWATHGSTVTVKEDRVLTLTSHDKQDGYSAFMTLVNQGTINMQADGGAIQLYGAETPEHDLGHLVLQGTSGTAQIMATPLAQTTITLNDLQGGGQEHILEMGVAMAAYEDVDFRLGGKSHYEGTIRYGVVRESSKDYELGLFSPETGTNLVLTSQDAAASAVLETYFIGEALESMHADVVVEVETAKVQGLTTGANSEGKSMGVRGSSAEKNHTLELIGDGTYAYAGALGENLNVAYTGSGKQTFSGGAEHFDGAVRVDNGQDGTQNGMLQLLNATSVKITDLTIGAKDILGVSKNNETNPSSYGEAVVHDRLTSAEAAVANANMKLADSAVVSLGMDGAFDNNALSLGGGALTLGHGMSLEGDALAEAKNKAQAAWSATDGGLGSGSFDLNSHAYRVVLFSDVSMLTLGDKTYDGAIVNTDYIFARDYFSNLGDLADYYVITFTQQQGSAGFEVALEVIPEPATSTLSLLALAALCARRRRK